MPSTPSNQEHYDYIIAGSGLSGLSLLHHLLQDEKLCKTSILVVDQSLKTKNDRTWCFWETKAGIFEPIVTKCWHALKFVSDTIDNTFPLRDYQYKMIRGIDFYQYVLEHASSFDTVTFRTESIESIYEEGQLAMVKTDSNTYQAPYVFNSTGLFNPEMSPDNTLLQHFMGWNIKAPESTFDPTTATLMDFRPSQKHGTTFMYVMPLSETEALVEYTLFTPEVLDKEAYEVALIEYIQKTLGLDDYTIEHQEFGVIPMSLAKFPKHVGQNRRIINMGTAGGYTKASTGYTFQFVQRQVMGIVEQLKANKAPFKTPSFRDNMFDWYDRTLLDVLLSGKMTGKAIFSSLFRKTDPELILAFLDNKSGFWKEFAVRNNVPTLPFMTSGIKQLFNR